MAVYTVEIKNEITKPLAVSVSLLQQGAARHSLFFAQC